jgi:hypothetical protein
MASFFSGENLHNRCLIGFDPSLTSILCSANSFGTPGMSDGFQAKISLLSRRKLASASSYFSERWALMITVLEGSPGLNSMVLMSASLGGTRMLGCLVGISSSSGLIPSAIVMTSFLSFAACAFFVIWMACTSQSKARFKSPLRVVPHGSWHLEQQVRVMWDGHKFCQCRSSEDGVI